MKKPPEVRYCSETHRLFCDDKELTMNDGHYYNFSKNGTFTLLNKQGMPYRERSLPLFEKTLSHILWCIVWAFAAFLAYKSLPKWGLFFMSLFFLHLFLFGCRFTTLMIQGKIKLLFSLTDWEKISRDLIKNPTLDFLQKHQLENHPGFLVNLALAQKNPSQARIYIEKAYLTCPEHPFLQSLKQSLDANPSTQ